MSLSRYFPYSVYLPGRSSHHFLHLLRVQGTELYIPKWAREQAWKKASEWVYFWWIPWFQGENAYSLRVNGNFCGDSTYLVHCSSFYLKMQKIRTFFSLFLTIVLFFSLIFPIGFSFAWQDKYDYTESYDKINISSTDSMIEKAFTFDTPRTTFSLVIDGFHPNSADDIRVEWNFSGKTFSRNLDIEDETDFSRVTTFPFVTEGRHEVTAKIYLSWKIPSTAQISLMSSFQESIWKSLIFIPGSFVSHAATNTQIISRSEWGADESIRYISKDKIEKKKQEWIARWQKPLIIEESQAEQSRRIQSEMEYNAIFASNPDATTTFSLKRYENGNKLYWPIEKSKKVDRIVIHHTAESLEQDADDTTLIRAIYLYHARTKGWWDIGYNFIVWQRGKIYEWRAGGDYVQWAHVYGNNRGTVGISLLWNYEVYTVNRDQKAWLIAAITYVAKKYGIQVNEQGIWATLCSSSSDCIWQRTITSRLMWHRDLAATTCPWKNLHALLSEFKSTIVGNVWNVQPIYNVWKSEIDKWDPEDETNFVLKSNTPTSNISTVAIVPKSSGGSPIKIRLSYPSQDITLASAGTKIPTLRLDNKGIPVFRSSTIFLTKSWVWKVILTVWAKKYEWSVLRFSSDLVRIPSWSRIPSWDTKWKYNDNVFRWRIVVRNVNGNLLVVNELPIEDYLKWLWEISNGDLEEKIKTIIVAARSYAYFYIQKENRKYNTDLYDGSDNPDEFQKYLGYGYESRSPQASKLVDATKREVIVHKWKPIKAWYFSTSDWRTRSYKEYCESNGVTSCVDIPYLQSIEDPGWVWHTRSGHGVWISWIGATYAASLGKTYKEIIKYYMKWVEIAKK